MRGDTSCPCLHLLLPDGLGSRVESSPDRTGQDQDQDQDRCLPKLVTELWDSRKPRDDLTKVRK